MAVVGSATLNVVPKINGLGKAVEEEIAKCEGKSSAAGAKLGAGIGRGASSGLVKSGAVVGAFASVTNKAMDAISSHIGSAVSRFDTLNNYPTVMQAIGYSAQDAQASIDKMSGRLQALPTRLDDMVSLVQGLVATTNDLGKATDVGLAFNDMLVASGASTQVAGAASEQFRQILAKGKPEMEDWRSLTSAMPGQMDQLAKAMLGPTANANDLYAAIGGGKNEAIFSLDELMDKMVELDQNGGEGFASFQEQAETAAGGVATAAENMGNAITKGIAGVMDEVGKDSIAGVLNDAKAGINQVSAAAKGITRDAMPAIKGMYSAMKSAAPEALALAGGVAAVEVSASKLSKAWQNGNEWVSGLTKGKLAVMGLSAAVGIAAALYVDWKTKSDNVKAATTGLADAVGRVSSLDKYAGSISGVGASADGTSKSVDELMASVAGHSKAIQESAASAECEIAQLNAAQQIIDEYAGKTDLTTEAQGKLQWALSQVNEQFGLSLTAADAAADAYTDAEGNVVSLKESIDALVESKKNEIKVESLSSSLGEAYKAQSEAASAYVKQLDEVAAAQKRCDAAMNDTTATGEAYTANLSAAGLALDAENKKLDDCKSAVDSADSAVASLEGQLGDAAAATSAAGDAYERFGQSLDSISRAILENRGTYGDFIQDIRDLGASTEDMAGLSAEQMRQLASEYDGSCSSIIGDLQAWGVSMDDAAASSKLAAADIRGALAGMDGCADSLSSAGVDVAEFSQKLADAGVSTEQLNAVGSENLAALAEACGGNMDAMVWFIQHYNDTPILDKDGNITVDEGELIDAQGNVYTWNGTTLVDKASGATVDDATLVDAQGNVWQWNGTRMQSKSASGNIYGNLKEAIQDRDNWNLGDLFSKYASATVDITRNVRDIITAGHASGGIRLHANGGIFPRRHARGAIATRAVPLDDIVGEDGAEAIVPLTNERYSRPFADLIAKQVNGSNAQDLSIEAARMVIDALPRIISEYTPVMGEKEFGRKARKAVAYA